MHKPLIVRTTLNAAMFLTLGIAQIRQLPLEMLRLLSQIQKRESPPSKRKKVMHLR
ncbi:MAG: hypothetical protein J0H93_05210 [Chlamydiales bacterium]|nr:hypothetical protein [Chlamydiales bacterium]